MTKRDKRLAKIRQNSKNVSFDELRSVLEIYGFNMRGGEGTSHHFFRAEIEGRVWTLTVPFKRPFLNATYVREALRAIDEIIQHRQELEESEDDDGDHTD